MGIQGDNITALATGGVLWAWPSAGLSKSSVLGASPASILAAYIIDTLSDMTDPSDGSTWPLYVSHMPDGTNVKTSCGAVYDTAAGSDGRTMNGQPALHPGVQLRVRSQDYETGFVKAEDIATDLDAVAGDTVVVSGSTYQIDNISRASAVISLGIEPGTRRRFLFTVNFLLTISKLV